MTQCEKIIDYCKEHGSITARDAMTDLGIFRLASRINDLERSGVHFDRVTECSVNRWNEHIHYTRYTLAEAKNG